MKVFKFKGETKTYKYKYTFEKIKPVDISECLKSYEYFFCLKNENTNPIILPNNEFFFIRFGKL